MPRQSTIPDESPPPNLSGAEKMAALALLKRRLTDARRRCEEPYGRNSAYACVRFEFASPAEGAAALFDKLGPIPPGMTLDRIEPRGPYSLANLRYATPTMQSLNRSIVLNGWRSRLRKVT
jgi:hypothetical protein